MNLKHSLVALGLTALLLAIAPSAALAASATQTGYDEAAPLSQVSDAGPEAPSGTVDSGSSFLPFTGLELLALLVVGVAFVGLGVLIRRASRLRDA